MFSKFLDLKNKILFLCCLFLTTACGQISDWISGAGQTYSITGKVIPFDSNINKVSNTILNCTSPKVEIYKISSDGNKSGSAIASSPINNNGEYKLTGLPQELTKSNTSNVLPYMLEVNGCETIHLKRLVTGSSAQNIHFASTLIHFLEDQFTDWHNINAKNLEDLFAGLEPLGTFQDVYSTINNDNQKTSNFQRIFNILPNQLQSAPPRLESSTLPSSANEGAASKIDIASYHWDSNYETVYVWKEDQTVIHTSFGSASFDYTPSANSQGTRTLTLQYGRKTTVGSALDITQPFNTQTFTINVTNTIPAQPPSLSVLGSDHVNTNSVNLQITTGAQRSLCESFSKLFLTVNQVAPPTNPEVFDITCDTDLLQSIPVTLPQEGSLTYRLWALDSSNNISLSSTSTVVHYSTAGPALSFTAPAANSHISANMITLNGTCDTAAGDVSVTGTGVDTPSNTTCALNGTFSTTVNFSAGEGNKDCIVSQTNVYALTGQATRSFVRDQTPPTNSLSFSGLLASPSNNTSTRILNLTGDADVTHYKAITISTGTCVSPGVSTTLTAATEQSIATPYSLNISSDATYYVCAIARDLAGNWQSTVSQSLAQIVDTNPPVLTIASPASGYQTQTQVTLSGSCEIGLPLQFSGTGIISDTTINCTTGNYNQTLFLSVGEGSKDISVSQTDLANNTVTVNLSIERDNTPPMITQTTVPSPSHTALDSITFGGACEGTAPITVKRGGVTESTIVACTTNTWSYTVATQTTDATRSYTFSQSDTAGNEGVAGSQWIRDTTAPQLLFTGSTVLLQQTTAGDTFTFSGSCENNIVVTISGEDGNTTVPCTSNSWSYTTQTKLVDQLYLYSFAQIDLAGNSSTILDGQWTRAAALPNLTITQANLINNSTSATFEGQCEDGIDVMVSGAETTNIPCPIGVWTFTTSTLAEATHNYIFEQTNIGGTTTVNGTWIRDLTGPVVNLVSLADNAPTSSSSFSRISLSATDTQTHITDFCIKINSATAPDENHSCWVAVNSAEVNLTPNTTLNLTNYGLFLGLTPGEYSAYAWAKDSADNVSALSLDIFAMPTGTEGVDFDKITYSPIAPPTIENILTSNSATIQNTRSERFINLGETVYIKWTASQANMSPGAVRIYFTTDDQTWTLITSPSINNGVNGTCVLDGPGAADDTATGCYTWENGSPTNEYYKIRVSITDNNGSTTFGSSLPINSEFINIIAGNTETGLNGSANSAVFNVFQRENNNGVTPHQFTVSNEGILYFNDDANGIIYVNPVDNVVRTLVKKTNPCTVNDAKINITTACIKTVYALDSDHSGNLWIYDDNRIRRINLNETPITIETIIGGGTETSLPISNAKDFLIEAPSAGNRHHFQFHFLPNNDLLFSNNEISHNLTELITSGRSFKLYNHASGHITSWVPSGIANTETALQNISNCGFTNVTFAFNPNTKAITSVLMKTVGYNLWPNCYMSSTGENVFRSNTTLINSSGSILGPHPQNPTTVNPMHSSTVAQFTTSKRGDIYAFDRNRIFKFDIANNNWIHIYGNNTRGTCNDNQLATTCPGDIDDIYVVSDDRLFFSERGRIRTIDSLGNVVTLFGQSLSHGDNNLAENARFNYISMIQRAPNGNIGILDKNEYKMREVDTNSRIIRSIIGNGLGGNATLNTPATETTLPYNGTAFDVGYFVYLPNNNVVINETLSRFAEWDRTTTHLTRVVGAGGTSYASGTGLVGTAITHSGGRFLPLGSYGNYILQGAYSDFSGSTRDSMILLHDTSDSYRTSILARRSGTNQAVGTACSDGTSLLNCILPRPQGAPYAVSVTQFSPTDNAWLIHYTSDPRKIRAMISGGNMSTLLELAEPVINFQRVRLTGPSRDYLYYCSGTRQKIIRVDFTDPGNIVEHTLDWPIESIKCSGKALVYDDSDPANPRLIFNFIQNGMHGVAEYLL